ncbi:MAG: molybdopterin molybdenumtransferase MoeA [Holophagaceae bacterium]|nr:molybdopterin molybdenumtransferase MoeA [Holophagaceae bacterium]
MHESCAEGGGVRPLTIMDARRVVLEHVSPLEGWESLPLQAALHRVLSRDVVAPFDVPLWDQSTMDGFALRAEDLRGSGGPFQIVGTAENGRAFTGIVGQGQAVRVMTGALMPRGADTVVPLESASSLENKLNINNIPKHGQHVRHRGEDLAEGGRALPAGRRLGPAELGILASLGMAEVPVRRRPRVALLSVGNPAASFGRPLGPDEAFDANRFVLIGLLGDLGVELLDLGAVHGGVEEVESVIRMAAQGADMVLAYSRQVNPEHGLLRPILARCAQMAFWEVNIKPGRPLGFGRLGQTWLFSLPANPVAVMVTYYEVIADALRKLAGEEAPSDRIAFRVRSLSGIRKTPGRREYLRGKLVHQGDKTCVRIVTGQGSGVLSSMAESDCFIVLPEDSGDLQEGDTVMVRPFHGVG